MTRVRRFRAFCILFLAISIGVGGPVQSAQYPERPVSLLIGYAAGGSSDTVLRLVGASLSKHFSQQFVVENRPGAGGTIAAQQLIRSKPDGYTLLQGGTSYVVADWLKKLPYNFLRDTTPVAMLIEGANVMLVSKALPVNNVEEFIDYCRKHPGKISFASSGSGTSLHMSGELFKAMAKCEMVHVPYRTSGQMIPDLISNEVQVIFNNLPASIPQIEAGNVRGLGVTSAKRWPLLPNMPAIAETLPGFEAMSFYGISAPKNTPVEIVETVNRAIRKVLTDPDVVTRLKDLGVMPHPMTKEEYAKYFTKQSEKWRKVVEFSGAVND